MPGSSSNDLVNAILASTNNKQLQQALLVGASGESNLNPNSAGSGGYGAFGFTSAEYTQPGGSNYVPPNAPAAQQVAAIMPSYLDAQSRLPAGITDPAAQAQWIALNAENPLYSAQESAQIEQTNAVTTYGANRSYTVQNWPQITQITSGTPANAVSGNGISSTAPPNATLAGNVPPGNVGSGLLSDCSSYRNSSAATTNCIVGGGGILGISAPCVLNACQAKALVSGMIVAGGALVMLAAVALLFTDSKAGLTSAIGLAAKNLATRTPGGTATMVYVDRAGNKIAPPTGPRERSAMASPDNGDFA